MAEFTVVTVTATRLSNTAKPTTATAMTPRHSTNARILKVQIRGPFVTSFGSRSGFQELQHFRHIQRAMRLYRWHEQKVIVVVKLGKGVPTLAGYVDGRRSSFQSEEPRVVFPVECRLRQTLPGDED
eukprot:365313-Chlamydomonas_euryale.AAC.24